MRLYLHSDLCKAEAPTAFGPTKRARGAGTPEMRIKATSHKKTAGMQRREQRKARDYASTAENKPIYQCGDCGSHVVPGKTVTSEGPMDAGKVLDHEAKGGEHEYNKKTDKTTLRHAPQQISTSGDHKHLEMGAVTAEMVPGKKMNRAGVQKDTAGKCPDCHKASGVEKSLALLDSLVAPTRKLIVNKSVRLLLAV